MAKKAIITVLATGFGAAAVATTIAFAVPAAAETGGQAVTVGQAATVSQADRPAYCDRIDKALPKRQAVVARLEGDANTRGSIAWLNAKAATATSAGNAELAKLYTDRAALRSKALDPLKLIVDDLAAAQKAHCS
jgi:hypothetical protein